MNRGETQIWRSSLYICCTNLLYVKHFRINNAHAKLGSLNSERFLRKSQFFYTSLKGIFSPQLYLSSDVEPTGRIAIGIWESCTDKTMPHYKTRNTETRNSGTRNTGGTVEDQQRNNSWNTIKTPQNPNGTPA